MKTDGLSLILCLSMAVCGLCRAEDSWTLEQLNRFESLMEAYDMPGAIAALEQSLREAEGRTLPPEDLLILNQQLGYLYITMERHEDAATCFQKALAASQAAYGKDDPSNADLMEPLAEALTALDRGAEAKRLMKQVRALRERAGGEADPPPPEVDMVPGSLLWPPDDPGSGPRGLQLHPGPAGQIVHYNMSIEPCVDPLEYNPEIGKLAFDTFAFTGPVNATAMATEAGLIRFYTEYRKIGVQPHHVKGFMQHFGTVVSAAFAVKALAQGDYSNAAYYTAVGGVNSGLIWKGMGAATVGFGIWAFELTLQSYKDKWEQEDLFAIDCAFYHFLQDEALHFFIKDKKDMDRAIREYYRGYLQGAPPDSEYVSRVSAFIRRELNVDDYEVPADGLTPQLRTYLASMFLEFQRRDDRMRAAREHAVRLRNDPLLKHLTTNLDTPEKVQIAIDAYRRWCLAYHKIEKEQGRSTSAPTRPRPGEVLLTLESVRLATHTLNLPLAQAHEVEDLGKKERVVQLSYNKEWTLREGGEKRFIVSWAKVEFAIPDQINLAPADGGTWKAKLSAGISGEAHFDHRGPSAPLHPGFALGLGGKPRWEAGKPDVVIGSMSLDVPSEMGMSASQPNHPAGEWKPRPLNWYDRLSVEWDPRLGRTWFIVPFAARIGHGPGQPIRTYVIEAGYQIRQGPREQPTEEEETSPWKPGKFQFVKVDSYLKEKHLDSSGHAYIVMTFRYLSLDPDPLAEFGPRVTVTGPGGKLEPTRSSGGWYSLTVGAQGFGGTDTRVAYAKILTEKSGAYTFTCMGRSETVTVKPAE